jgi:N-ethylmaleimide reductase
MYSGTLMTNSAYTKDSGNEIIEAGYADLVAFGKLFIANPDLVERFATQAPLNDPDPGTFYGAGPKGYIDYPFLTQTQEA